MAIAQKPYLEIMKQLGWKKDGGDGRTNELTLALSDRKIVIFCQFIRLTDKFKFLCEPGIAFENFRKAFDYVAGGKTTGELHRRWPRDLIFYSAELSVQFLQDRTDELIAWAQTIAPDEALRQKATPKPGWSNDSGHLTAVALLGNVELLNHYIRLRERENAAGGPPKEVDMSEAANLAPRCKIEHIDRALEIAEGRHPTLKPGMPLN